MIDEHNGKTEEDIRLDMIAKAPSAAAKEYKLWILHKRDEYTSSGNVLKHHSAGVNCLHPCLKQSVLPGKGMSVMSECAPVISDHLRFVIEAEGLSGVERLLDA